MSSGTFFNLIALLYYLCILLHVGLLLLVACKGSRRTRTRFRPRRMFFLLAVSLLLWQITLFLEVRTTLPALQLWLGRINFAAVVYAVYFALRFVDEVSTRGESQISSTWLFGETHILAALTLLTPLISVKERVESGHAITTYGPLFSVYLLHVLGYLVAALTLAFWRRGEAQPPVVRVQLTVIGIGMLVTGSIAFITNALLPYGFGDFRFCDIGTLSTLFFVLAIAYATFLYRLFDLRFILRETLVYGLLLAFVLGGYSSMVFVIAQYLTDNAGQITQFVVLLIAFSFDPLRRFLEEKTDRLLFGEHKGTTGGRKQHKSRRGGNRLTLALLFPWRRP